MAYDISNERALPWQPKRSRSTWTRRPDVRHRRQGRRDGIGAGHGNALPLTVTAERAGRHALTIRYSNGEQAPATHYNPDPVCRHADISVNGAAPHRVLFPATFHFNNFWNLSVPVTLNQGTNTLTFTADELPDFDGRTKNAYGQRSAYAPVIDQVTVTPLAQGALS